MTAGIRQLSATDICDRFITPALQRDKSFILRAGHVLLHKPSLPLAVLERTLSADELPSPAQLWARYCAWKDWTAPEQLIAASDYAPSKTPRYYQLIAINRTVQAIAQGQPTVEDVDLAVHKTTKQVDKSYEIHLSL